MSADGAAGGSECRVQLNGEPRSIVAGSTLADLLDELGREPRTVAIEHNGEIVARERFAEVTIGDGDRIEIVHFVQGG